MTIYLVPGLANDKRIFKNLIEHLKDYKIVVLEHIPHESSNESIKDYAMRLIQHQEYLDVESIVVGMSIGGLIDIEMAKIIHFKKVFLISTVKHKSEFPLIIRLGSKLKIHLPPKLIKYTIKPISILLKATNRTGAEYISKIINDSNDEHIIWAQKAVVKWDNNLIPDNYIHIHGTKDEIFPIKCVKPTHKIENGTHYMVMDRSKEISEIIKKEI
jgi:esterase/lipase